jgi:hypothetical protein
MLSACLRDFLGSLGRSTIKNLLPGKGRKPGGSRGPRSRVSLNHHDFSYLRMEAGGIEPTAALRPSDSRTQRNFKQFQHFGCSERAVA